MASRAMAFLEEFLVKPLPRKKYYSYVLIYYVLMILSFIYLHAVFEVNSQFVKLLLLSPFLILIPVFVSRLDYFFLMYSFHLRWANARNSDSDFKPVPSWFVKFLLIFVAGGFAILLFIYGASMNYILEYYMYSFVLNSFVALFGGWMSRL